MQRKYDVAASIPVLDGPPNMRALKKIGGKFSVLLQKEIRLRQGKMLASERDAILATLDPRAAAELEPLMRHYDPSVAWLIKIGLHHKHFRALNNVLPFIPMYREAGSPHPLPYLVNGLDGKENRDTLAVDYSTLTDNEMMQRFAQMQVLLHDPDCATSAWSYAVILNPYYAEVIRRHAHEVDKLLAVVHNSRLVVDSRESADTLESLMGIVEVGPLMSGTL